MKNKDFSTFLEEETLNETSLSRIWSYTQNYNMGIITAFRGDLPLDENKERNKKLERDIRFNGFGFVKITGYYVENPGTEDELKVKEESFVVISKQNNLKSFLKKEGQKFNQDSVLYKDVKETKASLIGTAEGRWPGLDKEEIIGEWKPNTISQFYSKFRGHRTFVFESFERPDSLNTLAYQNRSK